MDIELINETEVTTPYNDLTLKYFQKIILSKITEAEETLKNIKNLREDIIDGNSDDSAYSAHLADVSAVEYDKSSNYLHYQRTQKFIRQLYAALDRIENKTYGVCKETGKTIPVGRLEAVPHTQHCIESKNR
ncbi:MAG: TraR/DksA C4-type zinc finger protein [Balneolales bacterium]